MGPEAEAGPEDVVPKQTDGLHVLDGVLDAVHGDRIFGADVEVAFAGAEGIAGDHHPFDDSVGVAFQDRAVHEGAGVALVAVADDVLLLAILVGGELPFAPGREAGAPAAAEAAIKDFVDDFLGLHFGQDLLEGLEAIVAEGLFEAIGIDEGAAVESDAQLPLVEIDVVLPGDLFVGRRIDVKEVFDDMPADEVFFDDAPDVVLLDHPVEGVFREDLDEGPLGAEAEAADEVDGDFLAKSFFFDEGFQLVDEFLGIVGKAAGPAADDDGPFAVLALDLAIETFGARGDPGI